MSDGLTYEFKLQLDLTDQVMEECKEKIDIAMEKIGLVAERYAKEMCPVDTGRLRNSITHAAGDNQVTVGTNVEYAIYVELGARGRTPKYFIKNSMANHMSQYQGILDAELKR